MKTIKDIIGLNDGDFTISTIGGTKLFTFNELIEFFSLPLSDDEIKENTILALYLYINLFKVDSEIYLENKMRVNQKFKDKYLDYYVKKNINSFERMYSEILKDLSRECKTEEEYVNVLMDLKSQKPNDRFNSELLALSADIEFYLYNVVLNQGGNWQKLINEYNEKDPHNKELWYSISLQYMKTLSNTFKMLSFL